MQKIVLTYDVNIFERLFIEKSIESLYRNSIDSYRLKLHNPKTLIEELVKITQSSIDGVLTNNDYVKATSQELIKFLEKDQELIFNSISKQYFVKILNKAERNNYKLIIQASKLILKDNLSYLQNLITILTTKIRSYSTLVDANHNVITESRQLFEDTKKHILLLVDYLHIALINEGFTKQFLYNTIQSIFIHSLQILNSATLL